MNTDCFYQTELKNELEKVLSHHKNFSREELEFVNLMLFEVIKQYEFAKILIQQDFWVGANEGIEYLYFIDGGYLKFQKPKDFAMYFFTQSKFAEHLKINLRNHNRYGEVVNKFLEAAKRALLDYAVSDVFRDLGDRRRLLLNTPTEKV